MCDSALDSMTKVFLSLLSMLKVGEFLKFLSEINPQLTPVRLSFYNYLSHFHDQNATLTSEDLENFFFHSLEYAHWQQNKNQMSQEIQTLIQSFCANHHIDAKFNDIKWPSETQIIEIDSMNDFIDAIQCYLTFSLKDGEKFRLTVDQNKKIIAIVLNRDQSITVRHFDRKFTVRHGQLEPLRKNLTLHYTADLELDAEKMQRIEVAPFVIAQFKLSAEGLDGSLVRGYICQKFFDLKGKNLTVYPKLFYSIKRIEQYFVDRQSDPFYQETVSALERSVGLVKIGDPEAIQTSMDIMARAQNALEYVFTGDKLLTLLIRDLQHTLTTRKSSTAVVAAPMTSSQSGQRSTYEAENTWTKKSTKSPQSNHPITNSHDLTN